jgi:dienelactone hydrolase
MRPRLKRILAAALLLAILLGALWTWYARRDYGALFRQRAGRLVDARRALVAETAISRVYDVRLQSDSGRQTRLRMRVPTADPRAADAPPPRHVTVLMSVGLETGMRAIDLLEERDDLVVAAIDYDFEGEFDIATLPRLVRNIARLRSSSLDSVPAMLLALEFLHGEPRVDDGRIAVVGVSYGAWLALPAAALEPRAHKLILVQGGGEIGPVLAANAGHWGAPLPAWLLGWLGERLFLPFQPRRWIGKLAPRKLTVIAGRDDAALPWPAVLRVFHAAGKPKELIEVHMAHVSPHAEDIIALLSDLVLQELGVVPGAEPPPRPPPPMPRDH